MITAKAGATVGADSTAGLTYTLAELTALSRATLAVGAALERRRLSAGPKDALEVRGAVSVDATLKAEAAATVDARQPARAVLLALTADIGDAEPADTEDADTTVRVERAARGDAAPKLTELCVSAVAVDAAALGLAATAEAALTG